MNNNIAKKSRDNYVETLLKQVNLNSKYHHR